MTPYQYGGNNPIYYIDINGDSLHVAAQNSAEIDLFNQINQTSMNDLYTTVVDASGNTTLQPLPNVGTLSNEGAAYRDALSEIIDHTETTSVSLVAGDNNVLIGNINTGQIDIADVNAFGSGPDLTSGGALIHEVYEQFGVQVKGIHPTQAHVDASIIEMKVTGVGISPERPTVPNNQGGGTITVRVSGRQNAIIIHYQNGNVTRIDR